MASSKEILILGAGRVVSEYYLPALQATGLAGSVSIVDRDPKGLAEAGLVMPGAKLLLGDHRSGMKEAQSGTHAPLVVVALPNQLHLEACRLALESGFDVLCEKPLALLSRDCLALDALAQATGRWLGVAMVRRFLPTWSLVREMVQARELGDLIEIEIRDCQPFGWRPRSLDFFSPDAGGVLADMGIHYLDLLMQLLGGLEPVSYVDDSLGGGEASCTFTLKSSHCPVSLRLSRIDSTGAFIRVSGTRGTIRVDKADESNVRWLAHGRSERMLAVRSPFGEQPWPKDLRGAFCSMINAATTETQRPTLADAKDAGHATSLIEWAYARRPVPHRTSRPASRNREADCVVTGATGFIGGHLVEHLSVAGAEVKCLVRSPATVAKIARFPVQLADVNLLDPNAVGSAISGARHVYHLAYGRSGSDASQVTLQGTRNVVEAAIASGAESVVVLSTAYVFGLPEDQGPVDESFPYAPYGGEYGTSKATMERWVLRRAESAHRTRIVVLNPTNVYGPEGGAYTTLPAELARRGNFCWVAEGIGQCNFIYVSNVVDAIIAAGVTREAHGHRFILSDGAMRWRDFLEPFVNPINSNIKSFSLADLRAISESRPKFSLFDLAHEIVGSSGVRAVARRSPLVAQLASQSIVRRLFKAPERRKPQAWCDTVAAAEPAPWLAELYHPRQTVFSAKRAEQVLGWTSAVDWDEGSKRTVDWLQRAGYFDQ